MPTSPLQGEVGERCAIHARLSGRLGQRGPDFSGEIVAAIGFAQELRVRIELAVLDRRRLGVAGREQHGDARKARARAPGERGRLDRAGHHHVGEQQIDGGGLLQKLERLMIRMIAGELSGQRILPDPKEIIRTVGKKVN